MKELRPRNLLNYYCLFIYLIVCLLNFIYFYLFVSVFFVSVLCLPEIIGGDVTLKSIWIMDSACKNLMAITQGFVMALNGSTSNFTTLKG